MKTKIGHEDEILVKTTFGLGHAEDEIEDEIRPEDSITQRSRLRNASLKTRNSALQTKFGREDEIRP